MTACRSFGTGYEFDFSNFIGCRIRRRSASAAAPDAAGTHRECLGMSGFSASCTVFSVVIVIALKLLFSWFKSMLRETVEEVAT